MTDAEIKAQIEQELERQKPIEQALKDVVDRLVAEASGELHAFVTMVKDYLDRLRQQTKDNGGKLVEYGDDVLELQAIKLPVLMYFAADFMENWGLYSDVSKAEWQEAYDRAAQKEAEGEGRVVDMEIAGRKAAQVQDWVHKVKTRVHSRLKTRLKYADELYNGLRKVMTKRISEMEVFRREYARRTGREFEGSEDE